MDPGDTSFSSKGCAYRLWCPSPLVCGFVLRPSCWAASACARRQRSLRALDVLNPTTVLRNSGLQPPRPSAGACPPQPRTWRDQVAAEKL